MGAFADGRGFLCIKEPWDTASTPGKANILAACGWNDFGHTCILTSTEFLGSQWKPPSREACAPKHVIALLLEYAVRIVRWLLDRPSTVEAH